MAKIGLAIVLIVLGALAITYFTWPGNYPSLEHLREVEAQRKAACIAAIEAGAPSPFGNGCEIYGASQ